MPPRTVANPLQESFDKAYSLDTLFRQNRALEQQKAGSAMEQLMAGKQADLARQQDQQRYTTSDRETQGQGDLGAINEFLRGNQSMAREMGRMERGLPTPEAGYPGDETFKPYEIPARGAGALAGLIKDRMPKAPESPKPLILGEGAKAVDPLTGRTIGENPKNRVSRDEALAEEAALIAADKRKEGRTSIEMDAEGGYRVKTHPTEALSENANKWIARKTVLDRKAASATITPDEQEERGALGGMLDAYKEQQEAIAAARAKGAFPWGPIPASQLDDIRGHSNLLTSLNGLSAATQHPQFESWLGYYTQGLQWFAQHADKTALAGIIPTSPEYQAFSTMVNKQLQSMFDVAGKQMTTKEEAILKQSMPTMADSPTLFRQKVAYSQALTQASLMAMQALVATPRGKLDIKALQDERNTLTDQILKSQGFVGGLSGVSTGLPPSPPKSPKAAAWDERLKKEGK